MSDGQIRVLVCDDDRAVRAALQINLSKAGFDVRVAESADGALDLLRSEPFDAMLSDVNMPGKSGMELLAEVRRYWPDTRIVMMTGYGNVKDGVAAIQQGASDYVVKPLEKVEVIELINKAIASRALQREVIQLRREVDERYGFAGLIGATPAMKEVYERVAAVADSGTLVLISGETGTGKELIAHAIHYRSKRSHAPLVVVNCGALPESLLESELFGHEKGAFTGAVRTHQGKFEQADGGTLFLDEIGEIPPAVQVRLLRVLEGGSFTRVGGERPVKVDVRLIAATNRDLRAEVKAGGFRADLYYRLNVFPVRLPPLRDRVDDVGLLAQFFLRRFAERHQREAPTLSAEALATLRAHRWPGNVRELEHLMERTLLLSVGGEIKHIRVGEDEPLLVRATEGGDSEGADEEPGTPRKPERAGARGLCLDDIDAGGIPALLDRVERELIIAALEEEGGVQARAARRLGISRSNLNYRIGRLGIALQDIRFR